MGRHCQIVMGPAGSGKSTYCLALHRHLATIGRSHTIVNLDPAADPNDIYQLSTARANESINIIDIRDLITVQDVMEECELGPNGGLMFCMQFLIDNFDWLEQALGYSCISQDSHRDHDENSGDDEDYGDDVDYGYGNMGMGFDEDEYLIFDMPGQLELFTHSDLVLQFIAQVRQRLWIGSFCAVYLLDATFILGVAGGSRLKPSELTVDTSESGMTSTAQSRDMQPQYRMDKFLGGMMSAMSCMLRLGIPHVNILSKMDLIEGRPGELLVNSNNEIDAGSTTAIADAFVDPEAPKSGYANTWSTEEVEIRDARRDATQLDSFLHPDVGSLLANEKEYLLKPSSRGDGGSRKNWGRLNEAIVMLLEDYSMISFVPLNIHDEESIETVLYNIDTALQYGEDVEPKEVKEFADPSDI